MSQDSLGTPQLSRFLSCTPLDTSPTYL
jgi:hypothetical protein